MKKTLWNKFFIGFINGIAIILPTVVTVWLVHFFVIKVNNAILSPLLRLLAPVGEEHTYFAKGLIFIAVMFLIALIGWGAKIIIIHRVFGWGEDLLLRVPIMGRIYRAVKQISAALLGREGRTIFKQVALIEHPRKGLYSIGFITGTTEGEIKGVLRENRINVFIPTTPNPTSGFFIMVSMEEVKVLKMSVEDGMKLVISGGSVTPDFIKDNAEGLAE